MSALLVKARTALRLGLGNIARVAVYRLALKLRVHPVQRLEGTAPTGPFFEAPRDSAEVAAPPRQAWQSEGWLFGQLRVPVGDSPPDWLAYTQDGAPFPMPERPWWEIPDFSTGAGDIKQTWELSRMDWVLALAQRARKGDAASLARLNGWLADWCQRNPPYRGPNWKCGQEASIRVMHLVIGARMLGDTGRVTLGLRNLLEQHLARIAPTVSYALAQQNNHATSEAAALFMGGSWLASLGVERAKRWHNVGRRMLERSVAQLFGRRGSFSQYSVNYHRVALNTLCMAEAWRRHMELPEFSVDLKARAQAATNWLHHLVNLDNGDAPNIGANDGAHLFQLTDCEYRDHRPSVQLAMVLFIGMRAYASEGSWNHPLRWLGIPLPTGLTGSPGDYLADDGGFAMLRRGPSLVALRFPRFRFRPGQSDALHLDLWNGGQNLLRDAGTFSYHTEPQWLDYFGGVAGHNTIQFDNRDPMPRLGRFLFGDWLTTASMEPVTRGERATCFSAGYRDRLGAVHRRGLSLEIAHLTVVDVIAGFRDKAVLRWRLIPGPWRIDNTGVTVRLVNEQQPGLCLRVDGNVPLANSRIVVGWESRYYLGKTSLPVLEIEVHQPGVLTTRISWSS
jgi:hypothetical protein